MNKAKFLIGLGVLFSGSLLLSTVVLAEDEVPEVPAANASAVTKGSVTFKKGGSEINEDGTIELIKPGTREEFITMKTGMGTKTTGDLRFEFVPNIKFGDVKISSSSKKYPALPLEYTVKPAEDAEETTEAVTNFIPPFIQVTDESGKEKTFKVTAKATLFEKVDLENPDAEVNTSDLQNTRIKFLSGKLSNNILNTAEALDADATSILGGLVEGGVTLNATSDSEILTSKDGTKTNATASSIVLDSEYLSTQAYTAADKMTKILLDVPAGERPTADTTYESTITWNLVMAP